MHRISIPVLMPPLLIAMITLATLLTSARGESSESKQASSDRVDSTHWILVSLSLEAEGLKLGKSETMDCNDLTEASFSVFSSDLAFNRLNYFKESNSCLESFADVLQIDLRLRKSQTTKQELLVATLSQLNIEKEVNLTKLDKAWPEFQTALNQAGRRGLVPVRQHPGWSGDRKVYFARHLSNQTFLLTCRTFFPTLGSVANPLGRRTMECKSTETRTGFARLQFSFEDQSILLFRSTTRATH